MKFAGARRLIGGDFETPGPLSLGSHDRLGGIAKGLEGAWVASGRAALVAILGRLRERGARQVHLPAYLCQSVITAVEAAGMNVSFFAVDARLEGEPNPRPGDVVLMIHYFGWPNESALKFRAQCGEEVHLVEDFSQAMLSDWGDLEAIADGRVHAFFSARKFGPAPLGGWLNCDVSASAPSIASAPSLGMELAAWRSLAAREIRREYLADSEAPVDPAVERLYLSAFEAAEEFLDSHPDELAAPGFVFDVISGVDWEEVSRRRRANWQALDRSLAGNVQPLLSRLPAGVVPLGYPVRLGEHERDRVRSELADQRIFCPVHWPLPTSIDPRRFPEAERLSKTLLTLPVDQRYGDEAMERMAEALLRALSSA